MKGIKTILGVFAAASLLFSVNAFAQENNNRDENGKVVRGAYETNKAFDNMFIGVGAGWNAGVWNWFNGKTFMDDFAWTDLQGKGGPAAEIYVGKWFTPAIGTRIGYQGISNVVGKFEFKDAFKKQNLQNYFHGDFMWNFVNSFWGYKETRVWNPALYVTAGVLTRGGWFWETIGNKKTTANSEFAAGLGLYNNFRVSSRVGIILDLTALVTKESQYGGKGKFFFPMSATLGLAFNIGKTNFDRHSTITPVVIPVPFTTEQYNALKDKVAALEKENAALKNKVAALEKEVAPLRNLVNGQTYLYENGTFTAVDVKAGAPVSIYFDLGSAKISAREKAHLEYFTNNIATADTKVEVNGYADKATGSAKVNQALSEKRAKAVVDLLKKAGMPESNIDCKANGGVDIFNAPYKNRVVTIEVK